MSDQTLRKESAETIVAEANACCTVLTELEQRIQGEIDEIVFAAARAKRPPSDDDIRKRTALRAEQAKVQAAFKELAFVTLARLNNSADVAELQGRLDTVSGTLSDDLAHLRKIERYAEVAVKVADALAKLTAAVAGAVLKM